LFIGLNYPINVKINDGQAPDGTLNPFLRTNESILEDKLCVWIVKGLIGSMPLPNSQVVFMPLKN
jgi:hypothetical protein